MKRQHTKIMTTVVNDAGRCELCGSKRGLESHHIIPKVCGGDDSEENLICVCQRCHTILTPRALLTKLGLKKKRELIIIADFKLAFYEKVEEKLKNNDYGIASILDAIDEL